MTLFQKILSYTCFALFSFTIFSLMLNFAILWMEL